MANYIAEGVRFYGHTTEVKKISEIKREKDFNGYDGEYEDVSFHCAKGSS
jgi:hypothetical protein